MTTLESTKRYQVYRLYIIVTITTRLCTTLCDVIVVTLTVALLVHRKADNHPMMCDCHVVTNYALSFVTPAKELSHNRLGGGLTKAYQQKQTS